MMSDLHINTMFCTLSKVVAMKQFGTHVEGCRIDGRSRSFIPKGKSLALQIRLLGYNLVLASTTYTMTNARMFDTIQEDTTP